MQQPAGLPILLARAAAPADYDGVFLLTWPPGCAARRRSLLARPDRSAVEKVRPG
jgi:hypothetical protein